MFPALPGALSWTRASLRGNTANLHPQPKNPDFPGSASDFPEAPPFFQKRCVFKGSFISSKARNVHEKSGLCRFCTGYAARQKRQIAIRPLPCYSGISKISVNEIPSQMKDNLQKRPSTNLRQVWWTPLTKPSLDIYNLFSLLAAIKKGSLNFYCCEIKTTSSLIKSKNKRETALQKISL